MIKIFYGGHKFATLLHMNTKRTTLYLVALLICGASLGTLLTVNILGKPFEYAWVTVTRHIPEVDDATDVVDSSSDVDVPQTTWKEYTTRTSGITAAYPIGWHVLYDSSLNRPTPDTRGDLLYLNPNPIDTTPRDGSLAPVLFEFVRNSTSADLTKAISKASGQMTDVTTSTVTYNGIQWTKLSGTEDYFGTEVPGVAFFSLVSRAGNSILVKGEFGYPGSTDGLEFQEYLEESVSRMKVSE